MKTQSIRFDSIRPLQQRTRVTQDNKAQQLQEAHREERRGLLNREINERTTVDLTSGALSARVRTRVTRRRRQSRGRKGSTCKRAPRRRAARSGTAAARASTCRPTRSCSRPRRGVRRRAGRARSAAAALAAAAAAAAADVAAAAARPPAPPAVGREARRSSAKPRTACAQPEERTCTRTCTKYTCTCLPRVPLAKANNHLEAQIEYEYRCRSRLRRRASPRLAAQRLVSCRAQIARTHTYSVRPVRTFAD